MESKRLFARQRRAPILCIAASLTLSTTFAAQNPSLPNFQKVDDHVYRGAQPNEEGFKDLAKLGIKTIVDLRLVGEHSQADEERIVSSLGMHYVSIPMKGMSTPKPEQVAAVQALFTDPTTGPVFVHCRRGADRTGMVVAVYRISHYQWDNKKALEEAKSYGMSFLERSIQHYVLDYKPEVIVAAGPASGTETVAASASLIAVPSPSIR